MLVSTCSNSVEILSMHCKDRMHLLKSQQMNVSLCERTRELFRRLRCPTDAANKCCEPNQLKGTCIMLKIYKTKTTEQQEGKQLIEVSRKSTEKNPVPEDQKYRAAFVQPFAAIAPKLEGNYSEVFTVAIAEAFESAAKRILDSFTSENPNAAEIDDAMLSHEAIVSEMQSTQVSQRKDKEQIFAWYDASETQKLAATRYGDDERGKARQAELRKKFGSLASGNSGISADLAVKMISYVAPEDVNSSMAKWILARLEVLSKQTTADDL